ncbi:HlyC/CorC family transporter [Mesorhizobium microcysteis]|jgi:Mg2+/Co2+ transporter CorB|uniref:HlyC/CorC family transporter n=1 Tax=Neoaquamicrobium microcysteis TaxID=2682781 RepID=A0A5D4H3Q9_9HYPH|nr:HlyC/CorC family transporter [Mesorhizobium microcysteis]TYR34932.1 HlyC/CorC family transporter [Mesorhizobium microcysteis]
MTPEFWMTVGGILCLIFLSFLFSGTETGMTASSRARLHALSVGGNARAKLVESLIERKDRLIGALLIGNNLVNILASALATSVLLDLFGQSGVVYATILMTVVIVVFSEILPKSWALARPEPFALFVAPFARVVVVLFGALSSTVNWFVRGFLSLFGLNLSSDVSMLSAHEELRGAVAVLHREGAVIKQDRDRMGGLLDLHELEVSDIMVHRTNMRSINADDPPEVLVREILLSSHTRMPVWKGASDNIVGVVHAKDLLRALHEVGNEPSRIDIMKVASKPWFVPDTTSLLDQLNAFLRRKAHFAIVVDEYGEVEGLVTLEDIIEEIVGDIADEHDVDVQGVKQEADGSVVVDGSVPIRDLNRALDWKLPDEEATTIAGLVIHETQSIPNERQAFTFHGKRFIVMKRDKNRITRIRIRPADEA